MMRADQTHAPAEALQLADEAVPANPKFCWLEILTATCVGGIMGYAMAMMVIA
jgi:hypothetical protein